MMLARKISDLHYSTTPQYNDDRALIYSKLGALKTLYDVMDCKILTRRQIKHLIRVREGGGAIVPLNANFGQNPNLSDKKRDRLEDLNVILIDDADAAEHDARPDWVLTTPSSESTAFSTPCSSTSSSPWSSPPTSPTKYKVPNTTPAYSSD